MVYIKTYMIDHFYQQYLVLLTMAPRNSAGWLPIYIYIYSAGIVGWRISYPGTIEEQLLLSYTHNKVPLRIHFARGSDGG